MRSDLPDPVLRPTLAFDARERTDVGGDDEPKQPKLKVVAENSEADQAKAWASQGIDWPLRDLAANLLRIVRGAGKPYEVVRQLDELIKAFVEYQKAFGHWPPSHEVSEILSPDWNAEWRGQLGEAETNRVYAQEGIIRGALQVAASRLVGQTTQQSSGRHEMYEGVRALEAAIEQSRKEWAAKHPAVPPTPRKPKKPKQPPS